MNTEFSKRNRMLFFDTEHQYLNDSVKSNITDLISQNLQGGLLGCYIREDCPVYCMNEYLLRQLGYHQDDRKFALKAVKNFVHPDDFPVFKNTLSLYADSSDSYHLQIRLRKKDASYIHVNVLGFCYSLEDQSIVTILVIRDITTLITTSEELNLQTRLSTRLLNIALKNTEVSQFYYKPQEHHIINPERNSSHFLFRPDYYNAPCDVAQECVHPEDHDAFWSLFEMIERGEKTAVTVCRSITSKYWFRITLSAVDYDEGGKPVLAVGIMEDITHQKQMEYEHNRLSEINSAIMQSLNNLFLSVFRLDLEKGIVYAVRTLDDECLHVEGSRFEHSELLHRITPLYHPDDQEAFAKTYSLENLRELQKKGINKYEADFRRFVAGEYIWVSDMVFFENDLGNNTVIIAQMDVSARHRSNNIIEALGSEYFAIYYIDLLHDRWKILRSDSIVVEKIAVTEKSSVKQCLENYSLSFVHPEDRNSFLATCNQEMLKRELSPKTPKKQCIFRKWMDGHYEWMEMNIVLNEILSGTPRYVTLAIRNINDTMKQGLNTKQLLEDALLRAENANAAKSDFLSKMSHDIRTPMNAIIGMTSLADAYIGNSAKVKDCLSKINVASKNLLTLINEILDMSKIESGHLALEETKLNLSDFISEVLTVITPAADEKGQKIIVDIRRVEHENIIADGARLNQVFTNILSNAVKYSGENSSIHLTIEEISESLPFSSKYCFIFEDNGVGIEKTYLPHLFEPFSRADDSRISTTPGTGLGMAIAQNIIKMMNGDIQVISEPNKGSVFTVTIPLKIEDNDQIETEELKGRRILLANRNERDSFFLCRLLRSAGMECDHAASLAEAEIMLQDHNSYFAIILDHKLQEDITEAIGCLQKQTGGETPLLLLTENESYDLEQETQDAGITDFIRKPLFLSRIVSALMKLLHQEPEKSFRVPEITQTTFKGKRFLIVDDNELNCEITEELLLLTGCLTETAHNGAQALEQFIKHPAYYYDMILMDVQMPVLNGLEATRQIRNSQKKDASTIPIIAMTANAFAEDIRLSLESGMNEHLAKPVDLSKMVQVMKNYL